MGTRSGDTCWTYVKCYLSLSSTCAVKQEGLELPTTSGFMCPLQAPLMLHDADYTEETSRRARLGSSVWAEFWVTPGHVGEHYVGGAGLES